MQDIPCKINKAAHPTNNHFIYIFAHYTWITTISTTRFLTGVGVGVLEGLLYAVGGHDGPLVRKSVEVFNPETDAWSHIADMHLCRRNAGEKESRIGKEAM